MLSRPAARPPTATRTTRRPRPYLGSTGAQAFPIFTPFTSQPATALCVMAKGSESRALFFRGPYCECNVRGFAVLRGRRPCHACIAKVKLLSPSTSAKPLSRQALPWGQGIHVFLVNLYIYKRRCHVLYKFIKGVAMYYINLYAMSIHVHRKPYPCPGRPPKCHGGARRVQR